MPLSTVLFDLDGTLLPMDLDRFLEQYFLSAAKKLIPHGFDTKEFIANLWKGSYVMIKNNGAKTNEEAFWEFILQTYSEKEAGLIDEVLEDFYRSDFDKLQSICGFDPNAANAVRQIKEKGFRVALATNPLFPRSATESRIRWAGLSPSDFELYTTFESAHYTKPNPNYYFEVTDKMGVDPKDCLMVGNDTSDDLSAREAGIDVFLLTPGLINKKEIDISSIPNGNFSDLIAYIDKQTR